VDRFSRWSRGARIDSEVQRSIVDFLADDTDHLELLRLGAAAGRA